ncbi:MAG: TonB-dependent receptor [Phenylobacterium sp.]|uniref:TonB-dependent receptor n=1 Tax=Phenylobacterium sp. TaxID=1871053 RepID=UPI002735C670|nr:TonB-dependent receptor [Phenylobacterium sp.]MDP3175790.1 TonB-dependent receptor [Phenylobacterium sp.]
MRYLGWALATAAALISSPALAQQRAAENATRSADDAFGVSFGNEKIGLYNERDARGFSPLAASNVRIEGLYFDMRGVMPSRVLAATTVRVGLTAQSYPFPAPTGIAEYTLKPAMGPDAFSTVVQIGSNDTYSLEADAHIQVVPGKFGLSGAAMWRNDDNGAPFAQIDTRASGLVARWRPSQTSELAAFAGVGKATHSKFNPLVFTSGPFLPPDVEPVFFGQSWSRSDLTYHTYGVLGHTPLGQHWTFKAGLFRHDGFGDGPVADLYLGADQTGATAQHLVTNERPQEQVSISGEARLTGVFTGANLRQTLHLSVRGRNVERNFGGAASALIAPQVVGRRVFIPEPNWVYGASSWDEVRQRAAGVQYQLAWRSLGEATLGVQKVDYEKTVTPPTGAPTVTRDKPLFFNGALAVTLSPKAVAYASFTQGLEEVPLAPENALNAQEAPPAIHTEQYDFGMRYSITPRLRLVLGYFKISKPYFNLDPARVYRALGEEVHKGWEISLAGSLTDQLNVVAGALLQKPEVTGEGVDAGPIGPKPVSQPETTLKVNLDYRVASVRGLSVDAGVTYTGERAATSRTFAALGGQQLDAEAFTTLDLGMRYRFSLAGHASSFRAQVLNVFDDFAWRIYPSGAFYLSGARKFTFTLATDF